MSNPANAVSNCLERNRSRVAIIDGDVTLTYGQLFDYARDVARYMTRSQSPEGSMTAILCTRYSMAVTVLLGCVLAGHPYLPLAPGTPAAMVLRQMRNAGARSLVTDDDLPLGLASAVSHSTHPEGTLGFHTLMQPAASPSTSNAASSPQWVYALYTSGSSGNPKCVPHDWHDICSMVTSYSDAIGLHPDDRVASFASFGHDAAVVDVFSTLLNGATLIPANSRSPLTLLRSARRMITLGATVWHCVPTVLDLLADHLPSSSMNDRKVILGGEPVRCATLKRIWSQSPKTQFFSLYGQTECSVISGSWIASDTSDTSTLGLPLDGVQWCARSDIPGASRLWVSSPASATHRIIDGRFIRIHASGQWYDTGDLVETKGDSFVFVGRNDQVVNVAGYRVDLLEIERYVNQVPGVLDAVVVARPGSDGTTSIGCVLHSDRDDVPITEINSFLELHLPRRHLLTDVLCLDHSLPQTLSGKRDRRGASALLSARPIGHL
ncbi:AMP-binding protein [Actinomyces trachealis]|uniref:AMP-binding protein n=1 Tax=Actinomyces trachealis TaxID=2763540 RepID=UPI0018C55599